MARLLLEPSGNVFPKAPQPWGPEPESPQPGTETGASTGKGAPGIPATAPRAARSPETGQASPGAGAQAAGRQALSIALPFVCVPRRPHPTSWSESRSCVPTVEGRAPQGMGRAAPQEQERGAGSAPGPWDQPLTAALETRIRPRAGRPLRSVSEDLRPGRGGLAGYQVYEDLGPVPARPRQIRKRFLRAAAKTRRRPRGDSLSGIF